MAACTASMSRHDLGCGTCGHSPHLHPGLANPRLAACLACDMTDTLHQLKEALARLNGERPESIVQTKKQVL